jgi:hypothetical protein
MKIMLKNVRLSYANVWEPRAMEEGQTPMYSVALLMGDTKDGRENIAKLEKAIDDTFKGGIPVKFGGTAPKVWHNPLYEGDEDKGEAYAGAMYINAKSKNKPGIVDKQVNPIIDQTEVYSGCYANVSVNLYAFNVAGKKGVGIGLGNIQKLADGESLGGSVRAEAEFEAVDDSDDDLLG